MTDDLLSRCIELCEVVMQEEDRREFSIPGLTDLHQDLQNELEKVEHEQALQESERMANETEMYCVNRHRGWFCTRPIGHSGDHVAHGEHKNAYARWSGGKLL